MHRAWGLVWGFGCMSGLDFGVSDRGLGWMWGLWGLGWGLGSRCSLGASPGVLGFWSQLHLGVLVSWELDLGVLGLGGSRLDLGF